MMDKYFTVVQYCTVILHISEPDLDENVLLYSKVCQFGQL